ESLAEVREDLLGRPYADVGSDEDLFDLLEQRRIDLHASTEERSEPRDEAAAGRLEARADRFGVFRGRTRWNHGVLGALGDLEVFEVLREPTRLFGGRRSARLRLCGRGRRSSGRLRLAQGLALRRGSR